LKTPAILQAFKHEILPAGAQLLQAEDPVTIGGHRLAGRLTSSGTGVVYLARDRCGGLVTIRTTPAGTTEPALVRARLSAEAACARLLPSSCSAPLLHDGTGATPPYLVSGHVEGPSLERVIDVKGPLPPAMVTALATDLAHVLAAVHEADVVHGNLTPANVILTKTGLRVIDFGVAQELPSSGQPAEIGAAADNPGWLAPELFTGVTPGPACDIFGWGCLVAYAATGHSPHGGADFQPLDTGGMADPLRRLVDASAAEDPAARPTATDLAARLDTLPDTPAAGVEETEDPVAAPAPRHKPRRVRARATVSALVTIAALFFAIPTVSEHRAAPPPETPRPGPPPTSRHRTPPPNTAAMSAYDVPAPTRRPHPGRSRPSRSTIWMSCAANAHSGWCSIPGTKSTGTGTDHGPSGWRITWTSHD